MSREKIVFELECEGCGVEYELTYIEDRDSEEPIYCPFCGCDIDLDDVDEVDEDSESFLDDDIEMDELDFEDRH